MVYKKAEIIAKALVYSRICARKGRRKLKFWQRWNNEHQQHLRKFRLVEEEEMVNTCYIPLCQTGYRKRVKDGKTYEKHPIFKFPKKNPELLEKWIRFTNRKDHSIPKHGGVCSLHFEDKYLKEGQRTTLKWDLNPIPTIHTNIEGMLI